MLIASLGAKCEACGAKEDLQLDLVTPLKGVSHGNGRTGRLCFYIRQWRLGNVRLLCADCNQLKADKSDAQFWEAFYTQKRRSESSTTIKTGEQLEQQRNALSPREVHS